MLRVVQARQQEQVSGDGGLNDSPIKVATKTVRKVVQADAAAEALVRANAGESERLALTILLSPSTSSDARWNGSL